MATRKLKIHIWLKFMCLLGSAGLNNTNFLNFIEICVMTRLCLIFICVVVVPKRICFLAVRNSVLYMYAVLLVHCFH